jgi:flavin-dependent dehydrogenase
LIDHVLIVGAGPAGTVAATVLARAGVRVRLIDRAVFPRDKLCGDTLNPGTMAALRRLGLAQTVEGRGLRVDGMRVTGPGGVMVEGRYPGGLSGRALLRRDLDWALLQEAIAAGARFEPAVSVRRALVEESDGEQSIGGVVVGTPGGDRELRAAVTIGADGRRSALAFSLGLSHHPSWPRRWAVGAYYENVAGVTTVGEMHVRPGRYVGVASVPGGAVNVCLVKPFKRGDEPLRNPASLLTTELARDPWLRERFADARSVTQPVVLGPLAVDVGSRAIRGLVLAGDAAGFIDPMTGDGMRFAVRGGVLAAEAALEALARGWGDVHKQLARSRRREFGTKWRFNRSVRALVAAPAAVDAATIGARMVPALLKRMIAIAGDCGI